MRELTLWTVAQEFGKELAPLGKRSFCPIRNHKRPDKSFKAFEAQSGVTLYKCFSCDPPFNVGDAVALYAALRGSDRRDAWSELRDKGYAVPGAKEGTLHHRRPARRVSRVVPIAGDRPSEDLVLTFDLARWKQLTEQRLGAVEKYAESRGLDAEVLRSHDVVDVQSDAVGFGYREPATRIACRVKIRALDRKAFWIEPRPPEGCHARSLGPLYLADRLKPAPRGVLGSVVITEGEADALSLKQAGLVNVVSLPDGAGCAARVDLEPLLSGYVLWLIATDADEDGDRAAKALLSRASRMGATTGRVFWRKEGHVHKDANDALVAGFTKDDFMRCINEGAEQAFGYRVAVE